MLIHQRVWAALPRLSTFGVQGLQQKPRLVGNLRDSALPGSSTGDEIEMKIMKGALATLEAPKPGSLPSPYMGQLYIFQ